MTPIAANPRSKNPGKPSSPCNKVCVLDAGSGLCEGCGRTRDEIAIWGSLPEPRRQAIMAALPQRLRAAFPAKAETPST